MATIILLLESTAAMVRSSTAKSRRERRVRELRIHLSHILYCLIPVVSRPFSLISSTVSSESPKTTHYCVVQFFPLRSLSYCICIDQIHYKHSPLFAKAQPQEEAPRAGATRIEHAVTHDTSKTEWLHSTIFQSADQCMGCANVNMHPISNICFPDHANRSIDSRHNLLFRSRVWDHLSRYSRTRH
jgi:hypothetical protein